MTQRHALPLCLGLLLAAGSAAAEFDACVADVRTTLEDKGHDPDLVERAFADVEQLERILELDREQPEFVQTFDAYLEQRLTEERVERGREAMAEHEALLWQIHDDYGIPPRYLVALWGMETHYGAHHGSVPVIDAMTTLACQGRREAFFLEQLDATLRLLDRGKLELDGLRGSWAGAMGHTQFMPSTLDDYGIDYDGSGEIDLSGSVADALGSGAHYLDRIGWDGDLRWGRPVSLTDGFDFEHVGLETTQPLADWQEQGVRRRDGSDLPDADVEAALLLPMGAEGPAFLVYDNFHRLMRWNASISYALSVGLLADRLDGRPPLEIDGGDAEPLRSEELEEIQRRLNELGFDAGPEDGVLGPQTRGAVHAYQRDRGLTADAHPDRALLERLREEPD